MPTSQRWVSGILGLIVLGGAEVAVFTGKDGAATVALIVIAGLAMLLAVVGVVPIRATFGDKSIDMYDEDILAVDKVAAVLSSSQLANAALTSPIVDSPTRSSPVTDRLLQHATFEREMLDAITNAARAVDANVTFEALDDETRWDAIVEHKEQKLFVEVTLRLDVQAARVIRARAEKTAAGGCVVVISKEVAPGAAAVLGLPGAVVVLLEWAGDSSLVSSRIQSLLTA